MKSILLKKLESKLGDALNRSGFHHGKIGFVNGTGTLNFTGWQCEICKVCPRIVHQKMVVRFNDCQCFEKPVVNCFGIPVFVKNKCVGLIVVGGNELRLDRMPEIISEVVKSVAIYFQLLRIMNLSVQRWGEENKITLLGYYPEFLETLHKLEQFARSEKAVLITGESGTGKELFARSLYLLSRLNGKPFLSENCGRFHNDNLLVSELFGHKKGSFTGAIADHQGIFAAAAGGMVILDEVGELSPEAQKMLLRVIDSGEIKPLGSKVTKKVDVRIVSATNRDLKAMVEQGVFRADLFYRLDCLSLFIPPLRERGADWQLLLDYYLQRLNRKHGSKKRFSSAAIKLLQLYSWPGNIRELKNIVESGFWASEREVIEVKDFERKLRKPNSGATLSFDVSEYYRRMTEDSESFGDVIYKPFLERDLNRAQVKAIIRLGLIETEGSYKKLLNIFGVSEKKYKNFLNFLQHHKLKP